MFQRKKVDCVRRLAEESNYDVECRKELKMTRRTKKIKSRTTQTGNLVAVCRKLRKLLNSDMNTFLFFPNFL